MFPRVLTPALLLTLTFVLGACDAAAPEAGAASGDPKVNRAKLRATLGDVRGSVTVKRAIGDDWIDAPNGLPLYENDKVKTGPGASAVLIFVNDSRVKLGEDALIGISETRLVPGKQRTDLTVLQGTVDAELADTRTQSLSVSTPSATVRSGREIVFQ